MHNDIFPPLGRYVGLFVHRVADVQGAQLQQQQASGRGEAGHQHCWHLQLYVQVVNPAHSLTGIIGRLQVSMVAYTIECGSLCMCLLNLLSRETLDNLTV